MGWKPEMLGPLLGKGLRPWFSASIPGEVAGDLGVRTPGSMKSNYGKGS